MKRKLMLTHTQLQFFVLLRAGLWDKPVDVNELQNPEAYQRTGSKKNTGSAPNTDVDWPAIYRIAREQTVVGLIADAIGTLPKEQRPPMPILQKFIMDKISIEKSHARLNDTLNVVTEFLNTQGITSVLLKGQGVAQNYPHPTSRTCGDIDLYVGEKNYREANEIVLTNCHNAHIITECIHNMEIDVDGITVEIHHIADIMVNPRKNSKFQAWTRSQLDKNFSNENQKVNEANFNLWNNNGQTIYRPSCIFDAIFIMTHMLRHMFYEGVGLRQLCDWTMHLHKNHARINSAELESTLGDLDLMTAWNVFSSTAVTVLGLPQEELPLCNKIKPNDAEHVIQIMFETGNFGKFNKESSKNTDTHYIIHKWKRFKYHISYNMKIFPILPKLMMQFTFKWISGGINAFFKGL